MTIEQFDELSYLKFWLNRAQEDLEFYSSLGCPSTTLFIRHKAGKHFRNDAEIADKIIKQVIEPAGYEYEFRPNLIDANAELLIVKFNKKGAV